MRQEILCELCGKPMRQIGPYASQKPEGQPSEKFDGKLWFQCSQEECENSKKIVEIGIEDLEGYHDKMQKTCKCGHIRHLHGHRFPQIELGQPFPGSKRDGECETGGCECKTYIASQN